MRFGDPFVGFASAAALLFGVGTLCFPVPAAGASHGTRAEVRLPERADGAASIRDRATGMTVAIALVGAQPIHAAKTRSTVVYRHAGPESSDVVHRSSALGSEDFVAFDTKPAVEEVRYRVNVSAAQGLRLVAGVLELLDGAGVPRLRMGAPYVIDRSGAEHDAVVALDDCAADRDPAGPWGRPVTPPGRRECTVRVSWGGPSDGIEYPAVLDPAWTSTAGTMTAARAGHTATLLKSGKVLVVGGEEPGASTTVHLKSAELFDPGTNTFSATTSMTDGRSFHTAVLLSNGNVLVSGGAGDAGPLTSSEIYDLAKPGFRASGPLLQARREATALLLPNGNVLVAGGVDGSGTVLKEAELFASTGETWTVTGSMGARRVGHYLTLLSGEALAVAGITTTTAVGDLAATELYEPLTKAFGDGPSLAEERYYFAGTTFTNGDVLVAGGYDLSLGANTPKAELLDHVTNSWSSAGSLAHARMHHTLTAFGNGGAIAAGGVVMKDATTITSYLKSTELYDPTANGWVALQDMTEARFFHTATLLQTGAVLVTGGDGPTGPSKTAELLTPDATGTSCTSGLSCASGFCTDGVCCESACAGTCTGCATTSTGKANGTCAPVVAGKDPRSDCKDDGAPACSNDGLCNGAGACEKYPATPCTPKTCTADTDCTSGACADGICCDRACSGACEACTLAKKGSGTDGTCGPIVAGKDPDDECGTVGTGVCRGNGNCDGTGACAVPATGTVCAAAKCAGSTLSAATECDKAGDCTPTTTDCTPFTCDAKTVACKTTCATDTDCAAGAHCAAGTCVKSPDGTACSSASSCTSGECVDGYCCDRACTNQCEACDVANFEGTCKAITGTPHGGRGPCSGTGVCAGQCNGLASTCVFESGAVCGPSVTCADGSETAEQCNALGACVTTPVHACEPYGCGADACNTTCKTDADCAADATCDKTGKCVAPTVIACVTDTTRSLPDGGAVSCGAYQCSLGTCTTSCKTDKDCAASAKCTSGKCAAPTDDSGCGCRLSPSRSSGTGTTLSALLVVALAGRVRRRRRIKRGALTT